MPKPTFAQLKRRLLDEGANIDEMLASGGGGPPPEGEPPVEEAMPAEEAVESPAAESAEPPGADMAEGEPPAEPPPEEPPMEEQGQSVSPALVEKLVDYGPPDTWSTQTLTDLDPAARKELKDAWAKLSPDEQDDIRARSKARRRGEKPSKAGDIAISFGRK